MRYPALGLTMSVLESLFQNQALCAEFPFIDFAKKAWFAQSSKGSCGGCGHGRPGGEHRHHLLETVKAGLVSMPPERVQRVKDLLNTDKLILHFSVRGATLTKEL